MHGLELAESSPADNDLPRSNSRPYIRYYNTHWNDKNGLIPPCVSHHVVHAPYSTPPVAALIRQFVNDLNLVSGITLPRTRRCTFSDKAATLP
jgi:hypothetical protein